MVSGIVGSRMKNTNSGFLEPGWLQQPSSYGRVLVEKYLNTPVGWWNIVAPNGDACSLNPKIHTVTEHDDGTITVDPSIDMSINKPGGWHGWLVRGVFYDAWNRPPR